MQNRLLKLVWLSVCAVAMVGCTEQVQQEQSNIAVSEQYTDGSGGCEHLQYLGTDYLFCPNEITWDDAKANCESLGLALVTINDQLENNFVENNVDGPSWISATDEAVEGEWRWADGTQFWSGDDNGVAVNNAYANWDNGDPHGGTRDCGRISRLSGRWHDKNCSNTESYVCEGSSFNDVSPPDAGCTLSQHEGRAYWFCRGDKTWTDAQAACEAIGSNLLTVTDEAQNAFVYDTIKEHSWLGANDRDQETDWAWTSTEDVFWGGNSNGELIDEDGYANWDQGAPDASDDCARMDEFDDGAWAARDCTDTEAYVCGPIATIDWLIVRIDELVDEVIRRRQDPELFGGGTPLGDVEAELRDTAYALVALLPDDDELTTGASIQDAMTALGRAFYALSLARAPMLGVRPDGSVCTNMVIVQRAAAGVYTSAPMRNYYKHMPARDNDAELEATVRDMADLAVGLRCLNERDLSLLEKSIVLAFLDVQERMRTSNQTVLANALWDYTLPLALQLYDITKYYQFPKSLWIVRYPGIEELIASPLPRLAADVTKHHALFTDVPEFDRTLAYRHYCNPVREALTIDRVGVWLEDVVNDASLARVRLIEETTCGFLAKISEISLLGAGDCSLLEMTHSRYQCRSPATCDPPPIYNPGARPGEPDSPYTQFLTSRVEVREQLCNGDLGFMEQEVNGVVSIAYPPTVGCSVHMDPWTSLGTATFRCNVDIFSQDFGGNVTLAHAWITRDAPIVSECNSVFQDDEGGGGDPPEEPEDPPEDPEDEDDITDEYKDETKKADNNLRARHTLNMAGEMAKVIGGEGPPSPGFQNGGMAKVIGAANTLLGWKVTLRNETLGTGQLGECCDLRPADREYTMKLDIQQNIATAFKTMKASTLLVDTMALGTNTTVEQCTASPICGPRLDALVSRRVQKTIRHEMTHGVLFYVDTQRIDILTGDGRDRLQSKDTNATKCAQQGGGGGRGGPCGAHHRILGGLKIYDCAPDQPCGNSKCSYSDGTQRRFQDCVARNSDEIAAVCPGNPLLPCFQEQSLNGCFVDQWYSNWDEPVCGFVSPLSCGGETSSSVVGACCGPAYDEPLPPPPDCEGAPGTLACYCCQRDGGGLTPDNCLEQCGEDCRTCIPPIIPPL